MKKYRVEGDKVQDVETGDWFELDSFDYGYWNGCAQCGAYADGSDEADGLEKNEVIELQLNHLIDHSGNIKGYFCQGCIKAGLAE